ncbi:MAG: UbiD family decarboxylase domain-containing protein, partial [Terriglobales bacterium]
MAFSDLREFLAALEQAGELKRIAAAVDPRLEIAEVTDRVSKRGGPALLFENPAGYPGRPLLINQFGSRRRMAMALGVGHADEVAARIRALLEMKPPEGLLGKLKMLPTLAELGAFFPRAVKSGECQQVVLRDRFSVLDFPILQCWPEDGGRYITLPLVFT